MKELITSKIEEVRYNGGHSTRKPSTVTMAVPHKFAVQVADLIEEYEKQGIEPTDGLIRLELVAYYADPEEQEMPNMTEPDYAGDASQPQDHPIDTPVEEKEIEQAVKGMTGELEETLSDDDLVVDDMEEEE